MNTLKVQVEQADRRYNELERDFDAYRKRQRSTPESALREEVARLRAQLGTNPNS